jgi:hypothetical protein
MKDFLPLIVGLITYFIVRYLVLISNLRGKQYRYISFTYYFDGQSRVCLSAALSYYKGEYLEKLKKGKAEGTFLCELIKDEYAGPDTLLCLIVDKWGFRDNTQLPDKSAIIRLNPKEIIIQPARKTIFGLRP